MRHLIPALSLLVLAACSTAQTVPAPAARTVPASADAQFEALGQRFIADLTALDPVEATALGEHRYDALLPDVSAAGRARRAAAWRSLLGAVERIEAAQLTRENQVDHALLINELHYKLWKDEVERGWEWNPLDYGSTASQSLYLLGARDFAPWPQRLRNATARMEALPGLFAQEREELVPALVPRVHAETAAQRNPGLTETVEEELVPHLGELDPTDRARFDAALAGLRGAVAQRQTWIETVLVPQAAGEFRLGAQKYDQKMAFGLQSSLTRAELKNRATEAAASIRAEMYTLAQQMLKGRPAAPPLPATPTATQQQTAIEAAMALTYANRPPRDGVIAASRTALAQATDFVRAKGLVDVPDTPNEIIEMPRSNWGYAVAYNDAPGALETQLPNFFAVAPIPPEWSDAQAKSFLSEYNDSMIQDLAIHEAMPGHYLQLAHANRYPGVLRSVLRSGPFIEGWAVYAEALMAEEGYLNRDPRYLLTVLKMRLRSVTNTLLDIGIHTEGMDRETAMDLMMNGAFQQEREAAGKWTRANLSSVQLLSYFTGFEEHRALRAEAMQRQGAAFDLRKYNDAVLAHGSPPVKYVRALVLDLPIPAAKVTPASR